jgi:hypothetical protein
MDNIFKKFVATWVAVVLGLVIAATIVITNVFAGVGSGWTGNELAWIIAAIVGFIVWEAIAVVTLMVSSFKSFS